MAARYWVGNGGNWSDNTNHWASASNGAPGASLPTASDDVFFDVNSVKTTSQAIVVDTGTFAVGSMDWTGIVNSPTFTVDLGKINLSGSLTLSPGMGTISGGNYLAFVQTSGSWTINTNGKSVGCNLSVDIVGATLTLASNITNTGTFFIHAGGTLALSTFTLSVKGFINNGSSHTRVLNLNSGTVRISIKFKIDGTSCTLNAGTSTVETISNGDFYGGGKTFNILKISSDNSWIFDSSTFSQFIINDAGGSFGTSFTAGTTQTVGSFTTNASLGNIVKIQSTIPASAFTLSKSSGNVFCDYLTIQDSAVTGGATWKAGPNSVNVSGNSGWIFAPISILMGQQSGVIVQ